MNDIFIYIRMFSTIVLYLVATFYSFNAEASNRIDYELHLIENAFSIDTILSSNEQKYLKISGDHFYSYGKPGEPDIPYTTIRLQVPENAYNFSASITSLSDKVSFNPEIKLYPIQKEIPINEYTSDMFTLPIDSAYQACDVKYEARVMDVSRLENRYHVVTVQIVPFHYTGKTNILEISRNIGIRLEYQEKESQNPANDKQGFINIKDLVVNSSITETIIEKSVESPLKGFPRFKYYIISERSMQSALKDLAIWKTQKGYKVIMKAIEDIYEDSRYKINSENGIVDEAASLRKYLQDENKNSGSVFCLLVGDHRTRMPIRKVRISYTKSSDPNGDDYIPTDNYFSDLSDNNWQTILDDNGLYVCRMKDISYSPDIYVGRLLCHTEEEISNYISKLFLYEANPGRGDAEYLKYAALTVQHDGRNNYKSVLDKMSTTFKFVDCLLDCAISDKSSFGTPTGKDVIEKMNIVGYCSWSGHGEPGTIACSGIHDDTNKWEYVKALESYHFNKDNPSLGQTNLPRDCSGNSLDLLTNFNSPSVVYTLSCTTCPFDIYNGWRIKFDLPHTLASSYTVGGNFGGVAYLGNTRSGYFGPSSKQEAIFLDNLKNTPKIGIAEAMSKYLYTGLNNVRHAHNLIGDPEFEMWLDKPSEQNAIMKWGEDCMLLDCSSSIGGLLVMSDGQGEIKTIDVKESSAITLPYMNASDKMVSLGLFKTGYLPLVKLDCYGQHLTGCTKNFMVREAQLGCNHNIGTNVIIGKNATLKVRALDIAECGKRLSIEDGGSLEIISDKDVTIEGSQVKSRGSLKIKGNKVTLTKGFSVESGSSFSVNH